MWAQTSQWQIQESDVARGSFNLGNVALPASCNGSTSIGCMTSYRCDTHTLFPASVVGGLFAVSRVYFSASLWLALINLQYQGASAVPADGQTTDVDVETIA